MHWENLNQKMNQCRECPLNQLPYDPGLPTFGIGTSDAKFLFIGEAPGAEEAKVGMPFVGRAGKLLQQAMKEVGFDSFEGIFITNVAKHRPPDNRTPTLDEMRICSTHFLVKQIEILKPVMILALGKTASVAMANLAGHDAIPSSGLRGYQFKYETASVNATVLCTWHPSYILRTLDKRPELLADIQTVRDHHQHYYTGMPF